jgi:hypothetical protein
MEATQELIIASERIVERRFERRKLLKTMVGSGVGLLTASLLSGCGGFGTSTFESGNTVDINVLNFALNLEFLEAEYYLLATTGVGLGANDRGVGAGAVTGGRQVTFATNAIRQYAAEIAADELAHVRLLRSSLGDKAIVRPALNLDTSFDAAANAAGIGATFDPYANEVNFLLGAFLFEDVGVTAYKGAIPSVTDKGYIEATAGLLSVESYHAGIVRTLLYQIGGAAITNAQKISDFRDSVVAGDTDQGIENAGAANLVPTDERGLTYSRDTAEVIKVVYFGGATSGGFYPAGMNGVIK